MLSKIKISPSIIASDYKNREHLIATLKELEDSPASFVHLDVMDGKFVKDVTFDERLVEFVKNNTTLLLDVHLMVYKPEEVVEKYLKVGANIVSFHIESTDKPEQIAKIIKSYGALAGIAINPSTPVSKIDTLLKTGMFDLVLVMSVEPGKCGQAFLDGSAEKVALIKRLFKVDVEVDGGITLETAELARKAGANILVSGSTIFKAKNKKDMIKKLACGR